MSPTLLRFELLTLMRDTRTLFLSVLLPILLLPALLFSLHHFGEQRRDMSQSEFRFSRPAEQTALEPLLAQAFAGAGFREVHSREDEQLLVDGQVELFVRLLEPSPKGREVADAIARTYPDLAALVEVPTAGRPILELVYRSDRERSVQAFLEGHRRLVSHREELIDSVLGSDLVPGGFSFSLVDESSLRERTARQLGPALSAFLVLMLLGGGSVAALDSLAGERERGTLSTLFVSSLGRKEIIWTKFVAVSLIALMIATVQILNLAVYAWLGWLNLPGGSAGWEQVGGLSGLLQLGLIFLVVAIFTAALLLHISARSRSFKEAQLYFFPIFLVAFLLSLTGLMPGLPSLSAVSLVPLAGAGVCLPDLLAGRLHSAALLLVVISHLGVAWLLMKGTVSLAEGESFLGDRKPLRGEELLHEQFSQRSLPYFAFLGACLMVLPSNFAVLSSLKGQVLFNQLVLFGLGPLILLRIFRQPLQRAAPFRWVPWSVLLICVAMVPLGQIAANGLSQLLAPVLPTPERALEEMLGLLNVEATPAWQLYVLIGVLPAFCEEFAFRGVLLHALHKRMGPTLLICVTAVIFGLFHLNYFRVFPTAFLGLLMGFLTLATGSLWPAVLVHLGNNSLAVAALQQGWRFDQLPAWAGVGSALALLGLSYLVFRLGAGYPGTRWEKGR